MNDNIQDKYIITYSNYFRLDNKTFAFRKKHLFDISFLPNYKPLQLNGSCYGYWINRKWYSLKQLQSIIINEEIKVDVSDLQWTTQIELDECFNLTK